MSKYEFKGTPGEWRVISSKVHVVSDNAPGNVVVCRTGFSGQQGEETDETRERWGKDAQAISVVPELIKTLASLAATLDAIGGTPGTMTASAWRDFECDKKLAEAHAVLAKATGYNGTTEQ